MGGGTVVLELREKPVALDGGNGILPADVEPQAAPYGEPDVGHCGQVVEEKGEIGSVGNEIVGVVVESTVGLLHQASVVETETDEDSAPGVSEVEHEGNVDIVQVQRHRVGVVAGVVGTALREECLEADAPALVTVECRKGTHAAGIAQQTESLQLVTLNLRQGGTRGDETVDALCLGRIEI